MATFLQERWRLRKADLHARREVKEARGGKKGGGHTCVIEIMILVSTVSLSRLCEALRCGHSVSCSVFHLLCGKIDQVPNHSYLVSHQTSSKRNERKKERKYVRIYISNGQSLCLMYQSGSLAEELQQSWHSIYLVIKEIDAAIFISL